MTKKVLNQDLEKELNWGFITWLNFWEEPDNKEGQDKQGEWRNDNEQIAAAELIKKEEPTDNEEQVNKENTQENKAQTETSDKSEGENTTEKDTTEEDTTNENTAEEDTTEGNKDDENYIFNLVDDIIASNEVDDNEKKWVEEAKQNVEDAQTNVDKAEEWWDKKEIEDAQNSLEDELSKLQQSVEELWIKESRYKKDIWRLKQLIEDKNDELSKYEMENASYWKTLDTVKNNNEIRWLVKYYGEYKAGDKNVKPELITSLNNIAKDTLWIDITSLLNDAHNKQKSAMTWTSNENPFKIEPKVDWKGKPWLVTL